MTFVSIVVWLEIERRLDSILYEESKIRTNFFGSYTLMLLHRLLFRIRVQCMAGTNHFHNNIIIQYYYLHPLINLFLSILRVTREVEPVSGQK